MRVTGDSLRLSNRVRRPLRFIRSTAGLSTSVRRGAPRTADPRRKRMGDLFGATSTTEDVLSGVNLHGKRILVTGVSAGLGVETARSLAAHGAQVVGAARDLTKAEAVTMQVRKDAAASGGGFGLVDLDLASLKSVRAGAGKLFAIGEPFDVVIANAGVMATPFGHTADG